MRQVPFLLIAACTFGIAGCANTPRAPLTVSTTADAEFTYDGLQLLDRTRGFQRVWVKPNLQLGTYAKLLPVDAGIHYKREPNRRRGEFALSEAQMERFRLGLRDAVEAELTGRGGWQMTTEGGPDVLIIRGAIIDLVLTADPRQTAGRERSFTTSLGQATLVVEIFDSESREILARIADRRAMDRGTGTWQNNSINNRAAARELFRHWARRLREGLEIARTMEWRDDEAS